MLALRVKRRGLADHLKTSLQRIHARRGDDALRLFLSKRMVVMSMLRFAPPASAFEVIGRIGSRSGAWCCLSPGGGYIDVKATVERRCDLSPLPVVAAHRLATVRSPRTLRSSALGDYA